MNRRWEAFGHRLVMAMYPRSFRREYGAAVAQTFDEMLRDPAMSNREVRIRLWQDFWRQARVPTVVGAISGALVVLTWWGARTERIDPTSGMGFIVLLLVAAGFVGSWSAGSVPAGMWSGLATGFVSSVTLPGDYFAFSVYPYDPTAAVASLLMSGSAVMLLATAGAMVPGLPQHGLRFGRGVAAFFAAWREAV